MNRARVKFKLRPAILLGALFLSIFEAKLFSQDDANNTTIIDVATLPEIKELTTKDENFKLLTKLIEENDKTYYRAQRTKRLKKVTQESSIPSGIGNNEMQFFCYRCKNDDTLLSVASATCLPYDTIATLNNISSMSTSLAGRVLILGVQKGVYINLSPKTNLEVLLYKEYFDNENKVSVNDNDNGNISNNKTVIGKATYEFVALLRFTPTQRAFFMDRSFRLPLDTKVVSSEFGKRMSPVYHRYKDHKGIDFAAPVGDNVYACKSGVVAYVFLNDKTFGNYIILSHDNNMTSVYAHLSQVLIESGQRVQSGQIIGKVGKTGMVTGPHLHFELRQNGDARNPRDLLPL